MCVVVFSVPRTGITVKAKAIITTDVRVVGGECKSLKKKVVEALNSSTEGEHEVKFVLVARRQDDETAHLLKEVSKNFSCGCIRYIRHHLL